MTGLLESWWLLFATAGALYVLIACALVINTRDESMPGGGILAVLIQATLWPLVLALALVVVGAAAVGRVVGMLGQAQRDDA